MADILSRSNKHAVYYGVFSLLVFAASLYFIVEAVVANAWPVPGYSYANNYVSDLGVPICTDAGRFVCSPLYDLMNKSFFVIGTLSLVGMVTFASLLGSIKRWVISSLSVLQSVGVILVGIAPGSFAEDITNDRIQMVIHTLGALSGILGASVLAVIVGFIMLRRARLFATVSLLLGIVTPMSLTLQSLTGIQSLGLGNGSFERLGVYSAIMWPGVVGVYGLYATRQLRHRA